MGHGCPIRKRPMQGCIVGSAFEIYVYTHTYNYERFVWVSYNMQIMK
jgi:hypothetical protein